MYSLFKNLSFISLIAEGWQAFRDSIQLRNWEYKKALVHLQAIYGIFPYYKVSVENRLVFFLYMYICMF